MTSRAKMISSLVISLIYLLSSASKFSSPREFESSLKSFGLGHRPSRLLGVVIPILEFGLSLALITQFRSRVVGAVSTGLLGVFTVSIVGLLRRGSVITCGCFGPLFSTNISYRTVTRNFLLVFCSLLHSWENRSRLHGGRMSFTVILWISVFSSIILRIRRVDALHRFSHQNDISTESVQIFKHDSFLSKVRDLDGRVPLFLRQDSATKVQLVFLSPHCTSCQTFLRDNREELIHGDNYFIVCHSYAYLEETSLEFGLKRANLISDDTAILASLLSIRVVPEVQNVTFH